MGVMSTTVDRELQSHVAAAAAGDEVAFARIVAAHHEDMRRVCAFMARDEAIAEDGVQAAWAIAWRKLGTLRDPSQLRPWLLSVATNETKKLLKRRGRHPEVALDERVAAALETRDPSSDVEAIDLRAALERLDNDDRALLAMRYGAGFNSTELSVAIGISPSGTRNRLERLLTRLRRELS